MNQSIDPKDAVALLLANQQHIHENIKFADQKAVAFMGINGALLGVMYPLISPHSPITLALGSLACLLLAVGIGFAIWVIKPRGEPDECRGGGVVDSVRISQFSLDQYLTRIKQIPDEELLVELRTFIYDRAIIDREKYRNLKVSLPFSAFGWLMSLVLVVVVKVGA
ncbi:Pycsar system effector family protein [Sedimenticola thiotaurini]|uniref:Pycsar effector protein domain-containing protein n=1 Tax=Sedimenticola thiotaurini TaxID=1543721 RepID=A0A0F7K3K7_9GAMM|nr:Pycsar system effector family protein [Sedimenticola thiotaurini]AKH21835.1 hypothetical protein AAY24_17485 [Sedimenticola thiotaurini]